MTCTCTAPALTPNTLRFLITRFERGLFVPWQRHLGMLELRDTKIKREGGWVSTREVARELDKAYIRHFKDLWYDLDATPEERAAVSDFERRYGALSDINDIYNCDHCGRPTPGDGFCTLVFCPECRKKVPLLF